MRFGLVLIGFVLCWSKAPHHWKNASTLVYLGKKQLGSTFTWIVPRLVTHMKHLHTCLAEISSSKELECFIHLLSANNKFLIDLLKLAITGNFGFILDSWTQTIHFCPKLAGSLMVESRINPWLPVTAILKDLQKNFCLLRADKLIYFGLTNRYVNAIWVKNLGTIYGDVLNNCFLPWQTTVVEAYFSMVKCLQTTQYKQNQPKNSCM